MRLDLRPFLLALLVGLQYMLLHIQWHLAPGRGGVALTAASVACAGAVLALGWPLVRQRGRAA